MSTVQRHEECCELVWGCALCRIWCDFWGCVEDCSLRMTLQMLLGTAAWPETHTIMHNYYLVCHISSQFLCVCICVCVWERARETERDRERQLLSETWGERAESRVNKSLCLIFFFSLCCLWWFLHIFSTLQSQHLVSFGFRLNLLQETTTPSLPPSLSSHLLQSFIHTSALICVLF